MLGKLISRAGLGAAVIAGVLALGGPTAAEAKVNIWIGLPGFTYWSGPGYYHGHYRNRLTCNEGRRLVDHRGFNSVRATDCRPRNYHYRARRHGRWYTVRLDSVTGHMTYWRR